MPSALRHHPTPQTTQHGQTKTLLCTQFISIIPSLLHTISFFSLCSLSLSLCSLTHCSFTALCPPKMIKNFSWKYGIPMDRLTVPHNTCPSHSALFSPSFLPLLPLLPLPFCSMTFLSQTELLGECKVGLKEISSCSDSQGIHKWLTLKGYTKT